MSQVTFYRSYIPVETSILQYYRDFPKLSTAERAEKLINNDREMNKVFAEKIQDEMLGKHVDLFA